MRPAQKRAAPAPLGTYRVSVDLRRAAIPNPPCSPVPARCGSRFETLRNTCDDVTHMEQMRRCLAALLPPILIALFALPACGGSTPELGQTTRSPGPVPTTPGGTASPGSTPAGSGSPQGEAGTSYAFHINVNIDESGTCPGSAKCDVAFVPHSVLYFRATLTVQPSGTVTGNGTMVFVDLQPCQTLMPDVSSCSVTRASDGAFAVEGKRLAAGSGRGTDTLLLTMRLKELPKVSATMTTAHPSGPIKIPFDTTCAHLLSQMLAQARVFDSPFEVSPVVLSGGVSDEMIARASRTFEGTFVQRTAGGSAVHTIHGLGGLFFIPPDTPGPGQSRP
jgi:hypothetical protein